MLNAVERMAPAGRNWANPTKHVRQALRKTLDDKTTMMVMEAPWHRRSFETETAMLQLVEGRAEGPH